MRRQSLHMFADRSVRRLLVAATFVLASLSLPTTTAAQQQRTDSAAVRNGPLPKAVGREALLVYNQPTTVRSLGPYKVDSGTVVGSDVAVVDGPVVVAGHVAGRLVAINADVEFRLGARVDGDVLVVGGRVSGVSDAVIGGGVRVYLDRLDYLEEGDVLVSTDTTGRVQAGLEDFWLQWRARERRSGVRFKFTTAKTYTHIITSSFLKSIAFNIYQNLFNSIKRT